MWQNHLKEAAEKKVGGWLGKEHPADREKRLIKAYRYQQREMIDCMTENNIMLKFIRENQDAYDTYRAMIILAEGHDYDPGDMCGFIDGFGEIIKTWDEEEV